MMAKQQTLHGYVVAMLCLLLLPASTVAQLQDRKASPPTPAKNETREPQKAVLTETPLSTFAVSLVISLAAEARSYSDVVVRVRVLARAADVLWEADNVTARALFQRALEEAEKGDKEEVTVKTNDKTPPMVTALRRMSGRDLRFEVLNVMAKRDRALSEEYLAKLKNENDSAKEGSKSAASPADPWFVSEVVSKRLQLASTLLKDGQIDKALAFAAPVLNQVNQPAINFLSELRTKNAETADRIFAMMLSRAEVDAASDPNTVSGLSSYVFTPGLYITFNPEGGSRWSQPEQPPVAPANFPAALRDRFFQVGAHILLRPIAVSDQSARGIRSNVIKRLLPLFEQYAPSTAVALRTQLTQMSGGSLTDGRDLENFTLTQGIQAPPSAGEAVEKMQRRIDRAKTSGERDSIYASVASTLLAEGDERARDIADMIEDPERRGELRQNIDFEFVRRAIKNKATSEAIRLAQTGKLSNTQRASAYIDVARLLLDTERQRALELLEEAVREVNRIEGNKPDRALLLVGVSNQLVVADRVRAWEILNEAVKEANRFEGFTGENTITFPMMTMSSIKFISIGGENFSLTKIFQALSKDDIYRAVDLAKNIKYDAPRAIATLAIATTILRQDYNKQTSR